jgi:hypothetical protein
MLQRANNKYRLILSYLIITTLMMEINSQDNDDKVNISKIL